MPRRFYLQMLSPADLRPATSDDPLLRVSRMAPCTAELSRQLYEEVGREYHWRDRRSWSEARLESHLARPEVAVWVLTRGSEVAGFFELERHDDSSVEIVLLGLRPGHTGWGLGKHMLTRAVEEAWRMGATRVWLHTCTLDSPAALPNYLARGFAEYDREDYAVTDEPEAPLP